jgi:hypothetical protein
MASRGSGAAARSQRYWPLLIVVIGVAIGMVLTFVGPNTWRLGCLVIGSSLGIGAVERLALPAGEAGLLQVRSKPFDIAVLALAGGAIIALAILVPAGR